MRQCYRYAIGVWMLIASNNNLNGQVAPIGSPKIENKPQNAQQSVQPVQTPALPASAAPAPTTRASIPNTAPQSADLVVTHTDTASPLITPERAPFKEPVKAPEVEKEEPQGIETVNIPDAQGNWLFKRMWWQRAETQYEKIKSAVESIMESRMAFFAKRTEWDKTIFDPFYQDSGLGRGVLEELINTLVAQLNQERAQKGELDEKERDLLTTLESQKAVLEQLQKDVQKINDLDNAVDEAISVLIKQINVARNFEKQSWQNFKAIAQELNDKKARELYYGMVTYWQNINDIGQYIQTPFLQHFEKLGAMAKDQTEKVSGALKALKEKGIDFKKQWQQLEENNANQQEKQDFKKEVEEREKEEEAKKRTADQDFFASMLTAISDTLSSGWNYIKTAVQGVWDFTFGRLFTTKVPVNDREEEPSLSHTLTVTPAQETEKVVVRTESEPQPIASK